MSKLRPRIEIIANIAVVCVSILLAVVIVKNYIVSKPETRPSPSINSARNKLVGAKVALNDVDWDKNGQTLVLALQTGCHFCNESAPFYHKLAEQLSSQRKIKLVAALPQKIEDGKDYLKKHDIGIDEVRQASLSSLGVNGTPTLLLVDNKGLITDAWVGKLSDEKETSVMQRLQR